MKYRVCFWVGDDQIVIVSGASQLFKTDREQACAAWNKEASIWHQVSYFVQNGYVIDGNGSLTVINSNRDRIPVMLTAFENGIFTDRVASVISQNYYGRQMAFCCAAIPCVVAVFVDCQGAGIHVHIK